ncbi:MAG: TonB-dependent receptor [Bacteroidales bacterium]|nr:TonB-dependent receptor [Bacteroidales bacterium]
MIYRTLFFISILISVSQVNGQQIRITGASDRSPIENVAVFNTTRERSTISDSLGTIELSIFQANDSLIFQHPSYLSKRCSREDLSGVNQIVLQRKRIQIDEYVISASKYRESSLVIPYMVDILEDQVLKESSGLTSAEILQETGNIAIQKTQGGGGSPILRGFEANKILLVVDGVRLNNAIYRNGHLQNSITIDHSILERTEVIFGPTSIMYGSDALGGVIHYYTKDPGLGTDSTTRFNAGAYMQYASAMEAKTGHLDFSAGRKRWAALSSITIKDLGDIRMGGRRSPDLGDWGKVMHYVDQVNGTDSIFANQNPLIQKNTAYRQLDILQKIRYTPSQYVDWILNMQYSSSSDIDRLDQLNDYSGEELKYAEYYYGPQNRFLVSLKNVLKKDKRLFTNMTTLASFQKIDEDRYSRQFRKEELLVQQEDVMVFGLNLDLVKIWGARHKLHYGADFHHNLLVSEAWYENTLTGDRQAAQTRYPEGGSRTWSSSAYASYKWIMNDKLVLNLGSRYNWGAMHSLFSNPLLPYDQISMDHGALSGSAGMVYAPSDRWQVNAILSTGFRNPNVDDYGKVRAKDGLVTVPNPDLSPEYTYNAEIGISRFIEDYMKIQLVGFFSYLDEAIVRTGYQLNGEDSLYYDGDLYRITANYNAGEACIYGGSLGMTARLNKQISLKGTLNYTRGYNLSDEVPLGHIPPLFGRTSLSYRKNSFFLDAYVLYQGWKYAQDFSPFGEDNEGEAMEDGFPSWWTANLRFGFEAGRYTDILLSAENLLDRFYKPYASGVSAPGRNFILTARFTL